MSKCDFCGKTHPENTPAKLTPAVQYLHLLDEHYWFFVRQMVIKRAIKRFFKRIKGKAE